MSEDLTITCDNDGKVLSKPSPMPGYLLALSVQRAPTTSVVYAAAVRAPFDGKTHHFCGSACLSEWLAR